MYENLLPWECNNMKMSRFETTCFPFGYSVNNMAFVVKKLHVAVFVVKLKSEWDKLQHKSVRDINSG